MKIWLTIGSLFWASAGLADEVIRYEIPMENQGARTFYVQSSMPGGNESKLLIDTGSGHSVINETTLASLKSSGNATFIKNLRGVMADGSTRIVPLYKLSVITIGHACVIRDVEAVVMPGNTRQILGISALQKAAPFGLSFSPPILSLSNCELPSVQTASEESINDDTPAKLPAASPVELKAPAVLQTTVKAG